MTSQLNEDSAHGNKVLDVETFRMVVQLEKDAAGLVEHAKGLDKRVSDLEKNSSKKNINFSFSIFPLFIVAMYYIYKL